MNNWERDERLLKSIKKKKKEGNKMEFGVNGLNINLKHIMEYFIDIYMGI